MSQQMMKESILSNLKSNGFPDKKVSLPIERLYEAADRRNENLNDILIELESEGVFHEKNTEKIVFCKNMVKPVSDAENGVSPDMFKKAQEMMGEMSPDQIKQAEEMLKNMSPHEREEMIEKAKTMGLF